MLPGSRCHRSKAGDKGDIKSRGSPPVLALRAGGPGQAEAQQRRAPSSGQPSVPIR